MEKQGTNEDDSQSDPHPEAGIFRSQITQNSGPEVGPDMMRGGSEEIRNGHDMVTGATEEIRNRHDMVTGVIEETHNGHDMVLGVQKEIRYCPHLLTAVEEEIPYCSPGISSGQQKKARSPISHNFVVRTPLRQLKQTRFCWPFNNWRLTTILPMSITTITESLNCLNPSRQQCPPSTGNRRNLNCLKIYSKRV